MKEFIHTLSLILLINPLHGFGRGSAAARTHGRWSCDVRTYLSEMRALSSTQKREFCAITVQNGLIGAAFGIIATALTIETAIIAYTPEDVSQYSNSLGQMLLLPFTGIGVITCTAIGGRRAYRKILHPQPNINPTDE